MATPTDKDIANWNKILKRTSIGLLEDGSPARKMDENLAKALFRSAVRKKWMSCNQKLHFLESQRIKDDDPLSRRKWKYQCNICKGFFNKDHVDVDHIEGEKSFKDWSKAGDYARSILDVGKADLQLLCNGEGGSNCHLIKSTCERLGLDWRKDEEWVQGKVVKDVNALLKNECKTATNQKDYLMSVGVTPAKKEEDRIEQLKELVASRYKAGL